MNRTRPKQIVIRESNLQLIEEQTRKISEQELKTIKGRKIHLCLSDADCEKLFDLCGRHEITVSNLLENFIGDLICGTCRNGSDERDYAEQYFKRCSFNWNTDKSLVCFLLSEDKDLYEFSGHFTRIEEIEEHIKFLEKNLEKMEQECELHPEWYADDPEWYQNVLEEIDASKRDLAHEQNEVDEIKSEFLQVNKNADWEAEVKKVSIFVNEKDRFIEGENNVTENEEVNVAEERRLCSELKKAGYTPDKRLVRSIIKLENRLGEELDAKGIQRLSDRRFRDKELQKTVSNLIDQIQECLLVR